MKFSKINKDILSLAVPNIITNITVPLLGLVDLALMGHLNDPVYIGAIALGSIIFNVIYASLNFLRMGTTGITAQSWGAKNSTEISLVFIRSLMLAFSIAVFLLVFQFPIQWISFTILDGTEKVKMFALEYYNIRIWAAPATIGLYAFFGWFLGVQNARIPMIIAITINIINIGLNFLFVMSFGMKSDGVALATVIAQYSGLIVAIVFFFKKYKRFAVWPGFTSVLNKQAILRFFGINSDIFIRTILLLLTLAFFTNTSARMGEEFLAVNTILFQFFFIFSYFADGFAYAGESLAGKAFGERNRTLLASTIKHLFFWGWGAAIITTLVYIFGIDIFTKVLTSNESLIKMSANYSIWVILIPVTSLGAFIWDGIYIGVTASKQMRNVMIISSIVVFLPAYYLTSDIWGNHALWFALNIFLVARTLLMWQRWRTIKLF